MKTFPKDEQAKYICREWAADFMKKGMLLNSLLWQAVANAFDTGEAVDEDSTALAEIHQSVRSKIETAEMAKFLPKAVRKAVIEIAEEAKYLQTVLP
ncbi:hypothetical protein [Pseudomonas sp. LB3P25]